MSALAPISDGRRLPLPVLSVGSECSTSRVSEAWRLLLRRNESCKQVEGTAIVMSSASCDGDRDCHSDLPTLKADPCTHHAAEHSLSQ